MELGLQEVIFKGDFGVVYKNLTTISPSLASFGHITDETRNLEPVWPTKNGHSISITYHSSLITHNSSLITHHSIFHIRLLSSLSFHHSLFFTLFGGPTPVIVQLFFFFQQLLLFFFFPPGLAVRSGVFFFFSLSLVSLGTKEKRKKKE